MTTCTCVDSLDAPALPSCHGPLAVKASEASFNALQHYCILVHNLRRTRGVYTYQFGNLLAAACSPSRCFRRVRPRGRAPFS